MSVRLTIEFTSSDYDIFTGGSIGVPITERQGAIITSCLFLCYDRDAWEEMTDAETGGGTSNRDGCYGVDDEVG